MSGSTDRLASCFARSPITVGLTTDVVVELGHKFNSSVGVLGNVAHNLLEIVAVSLVWIGHELTEAGRCKFDVWSSPQTPNASSNTLTALGGSTRLDHVLRFGS